MTNLVGPESSLTATTSSRRALDRSLIHGIAWTGAAKWSTQLLRWLATIFIARVLDPADYGIVGMATIYLGLVQLLSEFGVGAAIIQRRDMDTSQLAQLGGFAILFGTGLLLASAALATPIALFFDEPAVRPVVIVLAAAFVIQGCRVLPYSLLTRNLRFKALALIDTLEAIVLAVATLTLAIRGLGYWALVFGSLAGSLASAGTAVLLSPHRIAFPRELRRLAAALKFGLHVVVSRLAWYAYSNADFAIVGRIFGKGPLGAYTIGWTIASIPVERIHALHRRVTPAIFAAVQEDGAALARYTTRITEGVATLTFPTAVGIALVADQFVLGVLGDRWTAAILPMRVLALAAAVRSLDPLLAALLINTGHARENRNSMVVAAVVLPLLFVAGSRWGLVGVAAAWIVGHPTVVMTLQLHYALRVARLTVGSYLAALWPAASSAAVMALVVVAARASIPSYSPLLDLGVSVAAGVSAYTAMMLTVHVNRVRAVRAMLREIRR